MLAARLSARLASPVWLQRNVVPSARSRSYSAAATAVRPAVTQFSEEEDMLRETVARFAKEKIGPKVKAMDEKQEMDPEVLHACFEQGLMGVEIDSKYGGGGMPFSSSIIVIEELAKVDASVSVMVDVQNTLVNNAVKRWGTPAQQEKYFPKLAQNTLGSFCLSEWESGSDAFALKTTATKKGNEYVLNGTKAWITNSKEAGFFIVMATVDPAAGYKGITAFVVEKGTPGLIIGKKENKLGIRASSTCEVRLEDCRVKATDILGELGKGYKIAIETLNEGRIGIGAQMLGIAVGAFESTIPYITQRKQFGKPISDFQGMQFIYADLATQIEAAKLMVYNAARLKDAGAPFVKEAAMAKLYSSEVAERVSSACVNMLGGVGFTKDFPQEKYYRDCKIGQIYEGTSNIQRQTIAKMVLQERGLSSK